MNLFLIPPALCAIVSFAIGAFVLTRNFRSPVYRAFALFCWETTWWQVCWFSTYFFNDPTHKDLIMRTAYMSITLLPVTYYHYAVRLLGKKEEWPLVKGGYLVGLFVLMPLLWTTNLYIAGYIDHWWGYYTKVGILHPIYLVGSLTIIVRTLFILRTGATEPNLTSVVRNRNRFAFYAHFIYSLAIVEYAITYDLIQIYPVGVFALLGAFGITSYAIVRHRLMDINLAIRRTTVFMMVYTLVLGLPLWGALAWETRLAQAMGSRWWVGLVLVYALLATAAHYANRYFQQKAEDRLMAEEHKAHEALRFISQDMMRFLREKTLLRQIARRLVSTLHISHAAIYLAEGENGHYRRKTTWYHPPRKDTALPEALSADSTLAKDLVTVRIPRVKEELKLHQQALSGNWREMTRNLDALQASVVIPTFHQRRFLGFLILGDKRSGRIWTQDDLNLLMVLANQAALAIENAQFHEAEEAKMIERERDQMALDISSAVSHQYSNRLQVIENLCWQSMTWLQEMLKKEAFDLVKLMRVLRTFESIRKECARGGEIAKGIMSLAKTIPAEFQPAEIPPMVRDAIEFVTFKHTRGKVVEEAEIPEIVNGLPPNLPKVSCNSAQLHDSIMNVIDNAVDAIEERIRKMRLKVLPLPQEPYKGQVVVKAQQQNGKIVITVEDNGIGIKEEDKRKVFVPLFTTKGSSQGTGPGGHGLGLFYIKRILMAHGGRITVESEYGKGACFTIELRALKEDEASHAA